MKAVQVHHKMGAQFWLTRPLLLRLYSSSSLALPFSSVLVSFIVYGLWSDALWSKWTTFYFILGISERLNVGHEFTGEVFRVRAEPSSNVGASDPRKNPPRCAPIKSLDGAGSLLGCPCRPLAYFFTRAMVHVCRVRRSPVRAPSPSSWSSSWRTLRHPLRGSCFAGGFQWGVEVVHKFSFSFGGALVGWVRFIQEYTGHGPAGGYQSAGAYQLRAVRNVVSEIGGWLVPGILCAVNWKSVRGWLRALKRSSHLGLRIARRN